jgi:hypothetical protein
MALLCCVGCGTEPTALTSGVFACSVPLDELMRDCATGSVCCADTTGSRCLPILGIPYQYCDALVDGQPQRQGSPVCHRADDCTLAISYHAPYCCPLAADVSACSFDAAPGCLTNTPCTTDHDCSQLPLPATCVIGLCQFLPAGSDLAMPADLSLPPDLAAPPDLSTGSDLANPDAGGFQCQGPTHLALGGTYSADCPSGSYCCANRNASICIADPSPTILMDTTCNLSGTYGPTCENGLACKFNGLNYNFCCPSNGGPNYCTTGPYYSGCSFREMTGGGCLGNAPDPCTQQLQTYFGGSGTAACAKLYSGLCVVQ